jgi:hypothetical protein
MNKIPALLVILSAGILYAAEPVGSLGSFIGSVELSAARSPGWKSARIGCKLFSGDSLRTAEESTAEIRWANGGMVRVAERSAVAVIGPSDTAPRSSKAIVLSGKVWANMKKITSSGAEFGVNTPTATAAIRGTVFRVDMDPDSATDVLVYDGKVAVKPADTGSHGAKVPAPDMPRHEVQGPTEVEGPHEVTLEEWVTIVAGQQMRVEKTGSFKTWQFDRQKDRQDKWVKYNLERDAKIK